MGQNILRDWRRDGFNIIRDNDNEGINPGADKIFELLSQFSPCLILIDELVVFLKNIYDKTNPICGSFDNNLSFIQSLSEAVSRTKNSLLVASLPESETEIGGESGQKVFEKLSKVFGRMDATWSAASQVESYEIVKRRIFKPIQGDKLFLLENTIKEFSKLYSDFKDNFPLESDGRDYQELLRKSFPIHPTLFDFLYEKWGSLEGFQRTRGVLRFVGEVIHHLWNSDENSSMVMPGSVYLNESEIQDELVRYIGVNWSSIISADIDGNNATSYQIDKEDTRLGKYSTTKRVARSIFSWHSSIRW